MSDVSPECWLPVVGFEGFLEVSDLGRVRSLDRVIPIVPVKHKPYLRFHTGKILDQVVHPRRGYRYITIAGGGKIRTNAKVHHLVLEAFVGPCPEGMICCHRNDIAGDNRLDNLRWDTRKANARDAIANGGIKKRTHCSNGHEYTPENTYTLRTQGGAQRCKTCVRQRPRNVEADRKRGREYYYRNREAILARRAQRKADARDSV